MLFRVNSRVIYDIIWLFSDFSSDDFWVVSRLQVKAFVGQLGYNRGMAIRVIMVGCVLGRGALPRYTLR